MGSIASLTLTLRHREVYRGALRLLRAGPWFCLRRSQSNHVALGVVLGAFLATHGTFRFPVRVTLALLYGAFAWTLYFVWDHVSLRVRTWLATRNVLRS